MFTRYINEQFFTLSQLLDFPSLSMIMSMSFFSLSSAKRFNSKTSSYGSYLSNSTLFSPLCRRIIWLGDLNYRLSLSYEKTRDLISKREWSKLLEHDQVYNNHYMIKYEL